MAQSPPGSDVQNLDAAAQIGAWEWQSPRCLVVPYREDKFPPDFLRSVWMNMAVEGLLGWFFPGMDVGWDEFQKLVAYREILLGFEKPDLNLAGAAILWDIQGEAGWRRAELGFAFFRRYWATSLIREIAEIALRSVYSEAGVDRLIGWMLADNLPARAFAKAMGFRELATVERWIPTPEGFRDAVVVAQDRETFEHGTAERSRIRKERGSSR